MKRIFTALFFFIFLASTIQAQNTLQGSITDNRTGETLIGVSILIQSSGEGTITDYNGDFTLETNASLPFDITCSYIGYADQTITITSFDKPLKIKMSDAALQIDEVEIKGQRISDKQKAAPQTVESMDVLAIKQTAAESFYEGLGTLKGVDLTAASIGFKVINTRGFNSTSPVRSLQIIDGVDNQAPGLNFSLGNFLGASELDIMKVDIVVGANSAFYGPNAFNGVISMETKNPFYTKGLSASVKRGDRNILEGAIRYADAFKNKDGKEHIAYKLNLYYLQADDWVADNDLAVDGSTSVFGNPGGWDKVNVYGDEYFPANDFSTAAPWSYPGLGVFHRTGYRELDLVDYGTQNAKGSAAVHIRTNPDKTYESPELILASNFGWGTTVYQGDNRFSLKNIFFFQNRLEFRKKDKYFIRAYMTKEDAGDSYDPYFTALRLQERAMSNEDWAGNYTDYWLGQVSPKINQLGYPQLDFTTFPPTFDQAAADQWILDYQDSLTIWHQLSADFANLADPVIDGSTDYLAPGTPEFEAAFNEITTSKSNSIENGTKFYDKSALYHMHGEYKFEPEFVDSWIVGANGRLYTPVSEGTIFSDTIPGERIYNLEGGVYTGIEQYFWDQKLKMNATIRLDKNQNFNIIPTPAASLVYNPDKNTFIRASFSSAIRNPTLADQYLFLNVGPAILSGNLNGVDSLATLESFSDFRTALNQDTIVYFNIDPIRPERVKTFELGIRTTLKDKVYVDAGYYFSIYDDFIGYNLGLDLEFDPDQTIPFPDVQAYRFAANSTNQVTTQGFSLGLNYYFSKLYQLSGNYSWNRLNQNLDDPIIPAFNTPEHKFNISLSGRDIFDNLGFNINYKWISGFIFEGSPQFTGFIPGYDLLDGQINYFFPRINTTLKLGGSNLLNNLVSQTYGGPRVGRIAYVSLNYEFSKK